MRLVCAAALIFALSIAPVAARDPACKSARGASKVLQTLGSCDRLYCSNAKEPTTPSALKVMDETFAQQRADMLELDKTIKAYERVCAKLVKKFCENCSDFTEFQDLHLMFVQKMMELSSSEQKAKEFQLALDKIKSVEGDLACFMQVKDLMGTPEPVRKSLNDQFRRVRCRPNY